MSDEPVVIIAGIDEAGYGPVLGPLASAACAFATPDADPTPDLWQRLQRVVGRKKSRDGRTLHVNDSKAVYTPSAGLGELERAVLCLCRQVHGRAVMLDDFIKAVDPDAPPMLAEHPWYAVTDDEPFPAAVSSAALGIAANAYAATCQSADTRCVHFRVRLLPERQFNARTSMSRNKAATLFDLAAMHLDDLMRRFADQNLLIVCDRQGGRSHYGALLRLMFEDWSLAVVDESDACSTYELSRPGRLARIVFTEKAEAQCLPVAAASMLAKYCREMLMGRFNRFWRAHDPVLKPTAGYYTDGIRFLTDIAPLRRRLGVPDVDLIRQR